MAKNDTVIIHKTDTVEIIKDKIVYKNSSQDDFQINPNNILVDKINFAEPKLKPDDINSLCEIKTNGNIS